MTDSYEDLLVSPTPGSPLHQEVESKRHPDAAASVATDPMPESKISLQTEILFRGSWTRKSVRILPGASIHTFLDKLSRKKYLPTTSMLGGTPLKSEQLDISFGEAREHQTRIEQARWSEPVWHTGLRDKVRAPPA